VKAEIDGEVLLEVSDAVREALIAASDPAQLVTAAQKLDADELADLAPYLPIDMIDKVPQTWSTQERAQLHAAMNCPEDSVGGRRDFELLSIRDDVSLEVVLRYLRQYDELPDHADQAFVLDRDGVLRGVLPLDRRLIAMTLNMTIGALVGMFIPLLLPRVGRDPAHGWSVLLTCTTDSMGVFIFRALATLLFRCAFSFWTFSWPI
jgi:magnesium transporter